MREYLSVLVCLVVGNTHLLHFLGQIDSSSLKPVTVIGFIFVLPLARGQASIRAYAIRGIGGKTIMFACLWIIHPRRLHVCDIEVILFDEYAGDCVAGSISASRSHTSTAKPLGGSFISAFALPRTFRFSLFSTARCWGF